MFLKTSKPVFTIFSIFSVSPFKGVQFRSIRTSSCLLDDVVVKCPAFAESITEGDLRWEKAVGDSVAEDDVICEIETDKTSVPVPSPCSGVIEALLVEDGATVSPGTALAKIKAGAAGAAPAKPKAEAPKPAEPAAAAPPPPPPPAAESAIPAAPPVAPPPPSGTFLE